MFAGVGIKLLKACPMLGLPLSCEPVLHQKVCNNCCTGQYLLPHFNQLEVLELTNILLPLYGSRPLPLVDTLHHLLLRAVSIQWMEGQVFPRLKRSTIINPPIRSHPLVLDVTLPACVAFQITNKNISLIR